MDHLSIFITISILLVIVRFITVVFHELGHALMGLALLKGNTSVYIGSFGDPKKGLHFDIGRLKLHFNYNPMSWNHGLCVSSSYQASLKKRYLVVLAGPFASLITMIICVALIVAPDVYGLLKMTAILLFISSFYDFFDNIKPNEKLILMHDGTVTYNDGQTLKLLRQYKPVYNELMKLTEFSENGEFETGIQYFNTVFEAKKNVHIFRFGIAFYMNRKQYIEVINLFKQNTSELQLNSSDYNSAGLAHSYSGQHLEALDFYNKSIQLDSDNYYPLNNRGYTYNLIGEFEEAICDFDKVITMYPKFAYPLSNRGHSKIKLGKEKEGLIDINNALELDPKEAYAFKNLAILLNDKGDYIQAYKCLLHALECDENTDGINELIFATSKLMNETSN